LLSAISSCTLPAVLLLARRRINASEPPCHNLETATLAQPPRLHAEKESQGGVEPPQPKVLRTAMGQPRLTRRLRIEEKISATPLKMYKLEPREQARGQKSGSKLPHSKAPAAHAGTRNKRYEISSEISTCLRLFSRQ
jgi:hypothetical protein